MELGKEHETDKGVWQCHGRGILWREAVWPAMKQRNHLLQSRILSASLCLPSLISLSPSPSLSRSYYYYYLISLVAGEVRAVPSHLQVANEVEKYDYIIWIYELEFEKSKKANTKWKCGKWRMSFTKTKWEGGNHSPLTTFRINLKK